MKRLRESSRAGTPPVKYERARSVFRRASLAAAEGSASTQNKTAESSKKVLAITPAARASEARRSVRPFPALQVPSEIGGESEEGPGCEAMEEAESADRARAFDEIPPADATGFVNAGKTRGDEVGEEHARREQHNEDETRRWPKTLLLHPASHVISSRAAGVYRGLPARSSISHA